LICLTDEIESRLRAAFSFTQPRGDENADEIIEAPRTLVRSMAIARRGARRQTLRDRRRAPKSDCYPCVSGKFAGRLKGRQAIAKLAAVGAARLSAIRFEPFAATETENSSVLEYRRIYNNDEASATNVCEVIFWRGEEIVESRVYHA
jgi:hypothetical protein